MATTRTVTALWMRRSCRLKFFVETACVALLAKVCVVRDNFRLPVDRESHRGRTLCAMGLMTIVMDELMKPLHLKLFNADVAYASRSQENDVSRGRW